MLQNQQLVAAGIHIDEVHHNHTGNVAQPQLAGNLGSRLTVCPQHCLPRSGRLGEGARVNINYRQGLGGLDDDVATRGQIHPWPQRLPNNRVDPKILQNGGGLAVGIDNDTRGHLALVPALQIATDSLRSCRRVGHNTVHIVGVNIPQHPLNKVVIPVE